MTATATSQAKSNLTTQRVRIAVVLDAHGTWSAAGGNGMDDEDAAEEAAQMVSTRGVEAVRFIEADVPLPEAAPTIKV